MKFDEILVHVGEFGWYQKRVFLLLCLPAMLCGAQVMSAVFTMASPPYRCMIPGYPNDTYLSTDAGHAQLINLTILPGSDGSENPFSECEIFTDLNITYLLGHENVSDNQQNGTSTAGPATRQCSRWVYDRSEFGNTAVTEFNMVCEDTILRSHSNMVQFTGGLFGSIFMGAIADIIGRKKAIMLSLLIQFVTSLGVFLSPSYVVMTALRGVAGIATYSLFAVSASTGIELVGPNKRTFTGTIVEIYWSVGMFLLLPIAYFIREWRYIQLALCLMTVPLFSLWWLIPESPRWLLDQKRYKETKEILEKICKSNGTKLPPGAINSETADEGPQAKVWSMFTHRVLVVRTLIIFCNWFSVNLLYYGLSLNLDNLAGSTYLNYFIGALVELVAYILCLILLDRTGRKRLYCFCMFCGGLACLAVILPVTLGDKESQWATTFLAMIGKLCASCCYAVLYIMSAELFPTVLRNFGIGCCSVFENMGGMVAPYIADMGIIIGGPFAQGLPMLVFGGISILAGVFSFALPETLHRALPETVQDAIDFDRERTPSSRTASLGNSKELDLQTPLASLSEQPDL